MSLILQSAKCSWLHQVNQMHLSWPASALQKLRSRLSLSAAELPAYLFESTTTTLSPVLRRRRSPDSHSHHKRYFAASYSSSTVVRMSTTIHCSSDGSYRSWSTAQRSELAVPASSPSLTRDGTTSSNNRSLVDHQHSSDAGLYFIAARCFFLPAAPRDASTLSEERSLLPS